MRTLPPGIPIYNVTTRPVYLLSLTFPETVVLYSSRETVTISGDTWTAGGFSVRGPTYDSRGAINVDVSIPSHDGGLRALVLATEFQGGAATLDMVYGEGGWTNSDKVRLFAGVMSGAPSINDYVQLSLVSYGHQTEFSPRHFARKPWHNHIPPAGERIAWGDSTSTLG